MSAMTSQQAEERLRDAYLRYLEAKVILLRARKQQQNLKYGIGLPMLLRKQAE